MAGRASTPVRPAVACLDGSTDMGVALRRSVREAVMRIVGSVLSPGGSRARLTVLIYHRVAQDRDPTGFDGLPRSEFCWQMELLASCCTVMHLADAVRALREGALPARAVCITFDDGYADNAEVALPALLHHGVPATFFIATAFLDGGRMFNDTVIEAVRGCRAKVLDFSDLGFGTYEIPDAAAKVRAVGALLAQVKYLAPDARDAAVEAIAERCGTPLPDDLMMSSAQVRGLVAAGMHVGGHTVNHPILARIDNAAARREIDDGRRRLEEITGARIGLFAYPNGKPSQDYEAIHARMVEQAGFDAAVSTAWGSAHHGSPRFELPRFSPWDRTPERFAARLAMNWRREQRELAVPTPAGEVSA